MPKPVLHPEKLLVVPGANARFVDPNAGIGFHHAAAQTALYLLLFHAFVQGAERAGRFFFHRFPYRDRVEMVDHFSISLRFFSQKRGLKTV